MKKIEIEPVAREERSLLKMKACLDRNGSPRTVDHLRWQYFDTAQDGEAPLVDLAVDSSDPGRVAGLYAVFPRPFQVGDRVVTGVQSLDTMTDRDFRRMGVFSELAKSLYTKLEDQGAALVYGFPNGSSVHGFQTKLGWSLLDPVPFLIRPLRTGYFLKKASNRGIFGHVDFSIGLIPYRTELQLREKADRFGDEYDKLWEAFKATFTTGLVRDSRYLNWRFSDNPRFRYRVLEARDSRQRLAGFCVFRIAEKHGGTIAYIMELMERPGSGAGRALIGAALEEFRAAGADASLAWCFDHSFSYRSYQMHGYLPLATRLRPIELHFGVRFFCDEPVERKDWYISYSDSDTV